MIGNGEVIKLHRGASQCTVFGGTTLHAHTPQTKRAGVEFRAHQANHVGLMQPHALVDGFKRGAVFPGHLNHRRDITGAEMGEAILCTTWHGAGCYVWGLAQAIIIDN